MRITVSQLRQLIREGRLFDYVDKTAEQSDPVQGYIEKINRNLQQLDFHKGMSYLKSAGFNQTRKGMYDGYNYDRKHAIMGAPVFSSETLEPHVDDETAVIAYARKPEGGTNRQAYWVVGAVLKDPGNAKLHSNEPKSKDDKAADFRAAFDNLRPKQEGHVRVTKSQIQRIIQEELRLLSEDSEKSAPVTDDPDPRALAEEHTMKITRQHHRHRDSLEELRTFIRYALEEV